MNIQTFIAAALAASATLTTANAAPVTIDFTAPDQLLITTPHLEDGFIVDGSGTSSGSISGNELHEIFLTISDTFVFTRNGGGLFQFASFDHRSSNTFATADEFQLLGFVNGLQVADFGVFASMGAFVTVAIVNTILIDELRLVGTGQTNQSAPRWDNFVFDTSEISDVPLPAALPLFMAGLGGLGWARRKRA